MPKRSCVSDKRLWLAGLALAAGCATPQYAVRQTPVPEESISVIDIERQISAEQAREFEQIGARPIRRGEDLGGLDVQALVDRLSRVTERPSLHYQAYLYHYHGKDPNAAALADGRIYISSGMINYLLSRGSREDELAFIVGHELAHTVAQHLVKRVRTMQQQQLIQALVAAGAAAVTRNAGAGAQQAGRLAVDLTGILQDVASSGYSQEQELEADQLGIRYVIRAGYNPHGALELLDDFQRFDQPWPFMRTHPYIATRRAYLQQYLQETVQLHAAVIPAAPVFRAASGRRDDDRIRQLRATQQLYPRGSVSWTNLQRQIDALERR